MDYKYINQLIERYWRCETSLEEEAILRAFFSQEDIPGELSAYKELFRLERQEVQEDVLGDAFDRKVMAAIAAPTTVKARTITMTERLKPLFKAAAVVAILLTLGNAVQVPFNDDTYPEAGMTTTHERGANVAFGDSAVIDSVQHTSVGAAEMPESNILK